MKRRRWVGPAPSLFLSRGCDFSRQLARPNDRDRHQRGMRCVLQDGDLGIIGILARHLGPALTRGWRLAARDREAEPVARWNTYAIGCATIL